MQKVDIILQSDGYLAACVRVPSLADAELCVLKLNHWKFGNNRIIIQYDASASQSCSVRSTPTHGGDGWKVSPNWSTSGSSEVSSYFYIVLPTILKRFLCLAGIAGPFALLFPRCEAQLDR